MSVTLPILILQKSYNHHRNNSKNIYHKHERHLWNKKIVSQYHAEPSIQIKLCDVRYPFVCLLCYHCLPDEKLLSPCGQPYLTNSSQSLYPKSMYISCLAPLFSLFVCFVWTHSLQSGIRTSFLLPLPA